MCSSSFSQWLYRSTQTHLCVKLEGIFGSEQKFKVTGALPTPNSWGHTVLSCDRKTHEEEVSVDTGPSGLIGDRTCVFELFGDRIWLTSGRETQWEMNLTSWFNCRVLSFGLSWLFLCVCGVSKLLFGGKKFLLNHVWEPEGLSCHSSSRPFICKDKMVTSLNYHIAQEQCLLIIVYRLQASSVLCSVWAKLSSGICLGDVTIIPEINQDGACQWLWSLLMLIASCLPSVFWRGL